jgi:UPF0716 protein FxsA
MPILVVLFIVVPLIELFVIIQVGSLIGAVPTIGLVLLTGLLGAALASSQGRTAWRRFNEALAEGRMPGREIFDGAMVIFGGALLLTPGFITDAAGILFLLPPTRALVRRVLAGRVRRRARVATPFFGWAGAPRRRPGGEGATRAYDVDGTAREVPQDAPELGEPERGG